MKEKNMSTEQHNNILDLIAELVEAKAETVEQAVQIILDSKIRKNE